MKPRTLAPAGALLLAALLAAAGLHVASGTENEPTPLPFDPLSQAEQDRAIQIAESDLAVGFLLNDYVVIGASLHTEKTLHESSGGPRLADVQFYDYTTDQVVWPVVDLGKGAVRNLQPVVVPFQPVLTGMEAARGETIALDTPQVAARLGAGEIASASHLWTGPGTLCPVHRCVVVGFYIDGVMDFSFFPVIDLSTGRLMQIIENDAFVPWQEEDA